MDTWLIYNEGMIKSDHKTQRKANIMSSKNKVTVVEDDAITEVTEAISVTFSAKDLATECGTDPKSFRRWLRTQTTDRANKGGRWVFSTESKAAFLTAYAARGTKGTEPTLPASD